MSDNLSNQFPRPPELQPLAAPPAKGQQIFSSVLIVAGFILLATGGWMFVQYQYEASKPPPARIVEVSLSDLTETPAPQPSPTKTLPFPASPTTAHELGDTLILEPTTTRPAPPTTTLRPEDTPTPDPTPTPTPEIEPATEPAAAEVPSLASNPLVVEEPAAASAAAEAPSLAAEISIPSPITRIVAQTIGLDAPVMGVGWITEIRDGVPINIWTVADYAAGWHKNSALPGQGGNIVLSGHHNINGEVFRYTIDMNVGDIVTLYMGDQPYDYVVVDKFIVKDKGEPDAVRRENAKWIGPFNEERLTLVTCWPYTNNTHRAIVIAKPVQ
ncbi:MAG: sortase [Chloroflexi bacterium]|nr:sortase [Chloroflexota bacterium]